MLKTPEEKIEPVEEGSPSVGAQLRAAREEKGLSLHQVADILRLRASQVHALEEGEFSSLPGQTFVTGFLRSYANLLDLDAVAIVELYKHEEGGGLHVPSLAFPEPSSGGRIPGAGILLGTFVVTLILLAGWFLYQESESLDFERVAELPEHLASKIRDLDETPSENAVDTASLDGAPQNKSEIPIAAPFVAPEVSAGNNPVSVTEGDPARDQDETLSVESASENLEVTETAANVETGLSNDASTGTVSGTESEPSSASAASETVATDSSAALMNVTASEPVADTSQAPVSSETQSSAVADVTEDPTVTVTPEAPQQATETPSVYPQDTLDLAAASKLETGETPDNPLPRTFGVENTDARIVVRAMEESWIEVKATNEKPVLSRVLKPGDVYMAPNAPGLILTTGNAGGLEIRVDGKEIRPLGGAGTILREVPLVAESLIEKNGFQ
ncbi:helix-turn-helix domain-containing protein [uncultured Sneathiella sp.]|uniref:helix-turn-helix domain-containing protein n=1 Tax=uncultured Sneathiella sp. TaxID=879315 RepID=UPI0025922511|nr:helix-turn-helix domain-containing protein [uncultured Sneathiella sp.]